MPCIKCFMRIRVVLSTAIFKQTALKLSCCVIQVIGLPLKSADADTSATSQQHKHPLGWLNVVVAQFEHLHHSRLNRRPKISSSLPPEFLSELGSLLLFFSLFVLWFEAIRSHWKFPPRRHNGSLWQRSDVTNSHETFWNRTWWCAGDFWSKMNALHSNHVMKC